MMKITKDEKDQIDNIQRTQTEKANLALAMDMYQSVLIDRDATRIDEFFPEDYIQHSTMAASGRDALKSFIEAFKTEFPNPLMDIKKVLVDGDHVVFHVHVKLDPMAPGDGHAVVDIFRIAEGKIQEHWEIIQEIPETLPHSNGMF